MRLISGINAAAVVKYDVKVLILVLPEGLLPASAGTGAWADRAVYPPAAPPQKTTASSSTQPAANSWRERMTSSCQ